MESNTRRAERALVAVTGLQTVTREDIDQDSAHDMVKNILVDIRHLCDRAGVQFDAADRAAQQHYSEELATSDPGNWPFYLTRV